MAIVDLRGVAATALPMELAALHRGVAVGEQVRVSTDPTIDPALRRRIVEAASFAVDRVRAGVVTATARHGLPDHVGPGMRLLCCGLNPSVHAADAGVGYVTGSNRFWPAMIEAGLTDRARDNVRLLRVHRIGMTDIVKRPTPRADELTRDEYRIGVERLRALCEWLAPGAVVMVGLVGWRAAVDRQAGVGWQPDPLGPSRVYVMPSTSGLNARVTRADLAAHLRAAASA